MSINLLTYPYVDTTITRGDITFTDLGNGSLSAQGTKSGAAYIRLESYDTLTLEAGTYTMRGTGYSYLAYTVELKPTEGTSTYLDVDANNKTFTVSEPVTVRVDLDVSAVRGTEIPRTVVYPQLEAGTELSPWTPYRPPTTIDAENAKQIRQTMDVVIQVTPEQGEPIVINNSNLVSCTVSLRSDLSIIEPTLPESEINIEAYFDDDISDVLASIPDETPVTYQAGYPGDMSPVRNFYLAEQITWQDNVMSIHAVDAVHKLDINPKKMVLVIPGSFIDATLSNLDSKVFRYFLALAGITPTRVGTCPYFYSGDHDTGAANAVIPADKTCRETLADIMNIAHIDNIPATYSNSGATDFWITYVDAGIPTLSYRKPTASWDISEDDCGDVKQNTDRAINAVTVKRQDIQYTNESDVFVFDNGMEVGSIDWYKNDGAFISFDGDVTEFTYGLPKASNLQPESAGEVVVPIIPTNDNGWDTGYVVPAVVNGVDYGGSLLINNELGHAYDIDRDVTLFTQVVSWNATYDRDGRYLWFTQSQAWSNLVSRGFISSDANEARLNVFGSKINYVDTENEYTRAVDGIKAEIENGWIGKLGFNTSNSSTTSIECFPKWGYESLFNRSNITGSFTWKGDPRMQPRDVVTFHRLDGTTEDITIENITITHEKGGTSAEITYRKGIC